MLNFQYIYFACSRQRKTVSVEMARSTHMVEQHILQLKQYFIDVRMFEIKLHVLLSITFDLISFRRMF
jgi:hypothetical protein